MVKILGTRGSVPIRGEEFSRYGGATLCVAVCLAGRTILLDAGTGLLDLPEALWSRELSLLLSHPHADHLLGLPMCPALRDKERTLSVHAVPRGGLGAEEQVRALMSPPLWPVGPEELGARIAFHPLTDGLALGPVTVRILEGVHSGGVTLLRLEGEGKGVVFATDCTLTSALLPALAEFARDCDLLLCDGQYSLEEWAGRETFGHSTWVDAAWLGRDCGAKRVRIIHHDPARTDRELDGAAPALKAIHPRCTFAYDGEEILL